MKEFVCLFTKQNLANEVRKSAEKRGLEALIKALIWKERDGTVILTHGIMAEGPSRNRVLDLVAMHEDWHHDLLRCPSCERPTLEPVRRRVRDRFSRGGSGFARARPRPLICRYCHRQVEVNEALPAEAMHVGKIAVGSA
ncbi:MAG: hypothetical protein AAF280_12865 [Pseudomonadota bacterium]